MIHKEQKVAPEIMESSSEMHPTYRYQTKKRSLLPDLPRLLQKVMKKASRIFLGGFCLEQVL